MTLLDFPTAKMTKWEDLPFESGTLAFGGRSGDLQVRLIVRGANNDEVDRVARYMPQVVLPFLERK